MLRKKIAVLLLSAAMAMTMLSGCGDNTAKEDKKAATEDQNKDDASAATEEEAEEAAEELDPEILAEQERQRKEAETKRKLAVSTEQKAKEYATKHPDVVADLISAWVKEGGKGNKQ